MIKDENGNEYATYKDIMKDLDISKPTAFKKLNESDATKTKIKGITAISKYDYQWLLEIEIDKQTQLEEATELALMHTKTELAKEVVKLQRRNTILINRLYEEEKNQAEENYK